MALISAIFSLLSKKVGDLLQLLFGWSIAGLFGRLPARKQTGLSVALILSILWPLLVVGCFLPKAAAWAVAFLPLHEWLGKTFLRVLWIALAVATPILVGFLIAWVAPSRKQRGSKLRTVLSGVPLTVGLFLSFLITFLVVPVVKIISMARRWEDDHVYLQVKEDAYSRVLQQLADACHRAGILVTDEPVPMVMQAPLRVLKWFARSALDPIVQHNPRRLVGKGFELYLYPSDLLIRGVSERMHRIRAAVVREMMAASAYMTQDPKAQHIEEQVTHLWKLLAPNPGSPDPADPVVEDSAELVRERSSAKDDIPVLTRLINESDIPYEDWILLYASVNHLALVVTGEPALVKAPVTAQESDTALAPIDQIDAPLPANLSTLGLLKEAVRDAGALLKTELALVRAEAQHRSAEESRPSESPAPRSG